MQNWKLANPYKHLHCAKNMQIWNFTEQRTSSHWSSFLVWFQIPTFPQAPPFNIQFAYWTWNSYKTNPFLRHKTIRCLDIKSKRCEHNVDHLLECSFFVQLRWLENDGEELISHNWAWFFSLTEGCLYFCVFKLRFIIWWNIQMMSRFDERKGKWGDWSAF